MTVIASMTTSYFVYSRTSQIISSMLVIDSWPLALSSTDMSLFLSIQLLKGKLKDKLLYKLYSQQFFWYPFTLLELLTTYYIDLYKYHLSNILSQSLLFCVTMQCFQTFDKKFWYEPQFTTFLFEWTLPSWLLLWRSSCCISMFLLMLSPNKFIKVRSDLIPYWI